MTHFEMFGIFVMGVAFFFPVKVPNEHSHIIRMKMGERNNSTLPTCSLYTHEFMKETTCAIEDYKYSQYVGPTETAVLEQIPPPPVVNYDTCYTAPDEELLISRWTNFKESRSLCSADYIKDARTNSQISNPQVACMPGFTETQIYYNVNVKSSKYSKYCDYWCNIRRVCCK